MSHSSTKASAVTPRKLITRLTTLRPKFARSIAASTASLLPLRLALSYRSTFTAAAPAPVTDALLLQCSRPPMNAPSVMTILFAFMYASPPMLPLIFTVSAAIYAPRPALPLRVKVFAAANTSRAALPVTTTVLPARKTSFSAAPKNSVVLPAAITYSLLPPVRTS